MIFGVLIPAAIIGAIALVIVLVVQRARGGMELSPRGLLRLYLYIASLAGIVVLTIGLASVVNWAFAAAAGDEFIYGGSPRPAVAVAPRCPPGAVGCVEPGPEQQAQILRQQEQFARQQEQQRERRRNEDLIRGITFSAFGALFWAAHWAARRGLGEEEVAGLRRGYLMLGTIVFGLGTIVLLPTGIYQALANLILPAPDNVFRQGADALGGGIVSLPIWLLFLRLVVTEFRQPA
jgi:hypothetical protein